VLNNKLRKHSILVLKTINGILRVLFTSDDKMGQAIATRFIQQQAASAAANAAANVTVPGVEPANTSDTAWWCKLLARAAGALAGVGGDLFM
jgi:hypothetical protein